MNCVYEFLNSEKALYLFAGTIGVISVIIGLLFLLFSNHKSFAITMIILGVLEMTIMFPTYIQYQQKIDCKVSIYKTQKYDFIKSESVASEKALKSFFWLKLTYGILIVVLILAMSFLNPKALSFGIAVAFILHLAFAITIDNFGEIYTKKYLNELVNVE